MHNVRIMDNDVINRCVMLGHLFGFAILWIAHSVSADIIQIRHEIQEYCQTEVFEATCPHHDEIIYIEHAHYGRMALGRCVQTDYGHVGCHADVLRHTDRRCSGHRICRIQVPDASFDVMHPCPLEFKTYFEVGYKCLKILVPSQPTSCDQDHFLSVTEPSGYLSSTVTGERGYGSRACPWRITLPRGQRINITLIDFSTPGYDSGRNSRGRVYDIMEQYETCEHQYAVLSESWSSKRTHTVCGGEDREKNVFLSRTNSVEVAMISDSQQQFGHENFFVLRYEAVGCPHPDPPLHGWLERDVDGALVGCNYTSRTWRLFCEGTEWTGPWHNCTEEPPPPVPMMPAMVKWGKLSLPYGVSVGVIVGLAVIVGVIMMLVGLICLEWRKMRTTEKTGMLSVSNKSDSIPHSDPPKLDDNDYHNDYDDDHYHQQHTTYTEEPHALINMDDDDDDRKDYTYVREMWPLAPPAPGNVNGQNLFDGGLAQSEQSSLDLDFIPTLMTPGSPPKTDPHIYESPRTVRKGDKSSENGHYFELDPKSREKTEQFNTIRRVKEVDIDDERYKPCLV